MQNVSIVEFKDIFGQPDIGHLTAIESEVDVPFPINRIYYISQVPAEVVRGFHSHRDLQQVLICLHGEVKIRVAWPGEEEIHCLSSPTKGLYIGPMIWREMFDFSPGSVLMVLASKHYDEGDYIRDYVQYVAEANPYWNK